MLRCAESEAAGLNRGQHTGLFGFSKSDRDRRLSLRDVLDLTDDIKTDIMKRSVKKGYIAKANTYSSQSRGFTSASGSKVVSVITEAHSLDVEMAADDYSRLFHALQVLVDYHRAKRAEEGTSS